MDTLSAFSNTRLVSSQPINSYAMSQTITDSQNVSHSANDVRGVEDAKKVDSESAQKNSSTQDANIILETVKNDQLEDPSELANKLQDSMEKCTKKFNNLRFRANEDPTCRVISVVDPETNETIKQIPTEEALELMKRMDSLREDLQASTNSTTKKADSKSILMDALV